MKVVSDFEEYKLLDLCDGKKYESWNNVTLVRPDPEVIWNEQLTDKEWKCDAYYTRSNKGGGAWSINSKYMKDSWEIHYKDLTFNLKLMGFKHTGLFPEQAYNWNIIRDKIKKANRKVKVLNLFAYTGGASIAALAEHAIVTHVDSSRGMVDWAKENVRSSNLENEECHFLVDDVVKFVEREIRRGNKYDIIIMDPPSFGRGSNKEVWNIETDLYDLVKKCSQILSDKPIMFLINSYTTGLSQTVLANILKLTVDKKYKGNIVTDEIGLPVKDKDIILPCGIFARWESEKYED